MGGFFGWALRLGNRRKGSGAAPSNILTFDGEPLTFDGQNLTVPE